MSMQIFAKTPSLRIEFNRDNNRYYLFIGLELRKEGSLPWLRSYLIDSAGYNFEYINLVQQIDGVRYDTDSLMLEACQFNVLDRYGLPNGQSVVRTSVSANDGDFLYYDVIHYYDGVYQAMTFTTMAQSGAVMRGIAGDSGYRLPNH